MSKKEYRSWLSLQQSGEVRRPRRILQAHAAQQAWRGRMPLVAGVMLLVITVAGSAAARGLNSEAKSPATVGVLCAANASSQGQGRSRGGRTDAVDNHLDVLFITDLPETDIILQGEKIGTTGKDGQLLVKIVPGDYRAAASRAGYQLQQRTIFVSKRQTSFKFFMGQPIPAQTAGPTPTPIVIATPRPTGGSPTPPPGRDASTTGGNGSSQPDTGDANPVPGSTTVIDTFLDPKTSDQVKQPDWQSLLTSTYQELAREPNNVQLKAQAQFAQGQLDYLNGNFPNALQAFLNAQRFVPDYALASYGLGNVYLATNQPLQAAKAFEQAAALNPKLGLAYKGLGDALLVQKKEKEASAAYAQARELGYLSSDTNLNVARSLVKAGRWADAAATLRPLAAGENPPAEVFILLGDSYTGQKQTINAFQAYTKATELDQNSPIAFYKLGEVQLRERNYEAAKEALERALTLDPDGRLIDRRKGRKLADEAGEKLQKITGRVKKPGLP